MVSLSSSIGFVLLFYTTVIFLRAEGVPKANLEEHRFGIEGRVIALPKIEILKTVKQPRTRFTGTFHSKYAVSDREDDTEMSFEEEQLYLSWEIASPRTGKRLEQFVRVQSGEMEENLMESARSNLQDEQQDETENQLQETGSPTVLNTIKHRGRRNIYGFDSRFYIPSRLLGRRFPFVSVVKLSTGCTGTLVSPRHVLTSAHCIHDQKDYVSGYKNLKVGFLQSNGKFKWKTVSESYLPTGWRIGLPEIASKFDYSLLKLETAHNKPFFELGISENTTNGVRKRIHFTAFEDDKRGNTLWYRYCRVREVDAHVMYHHCDAVPGSSGAGVYLWEFDKEDKAWERRLVGVFSGNRWRYYKEWWKKPANFNAAIRIDSAKYTQICRWMGTHASKTCKEKYYTSK